MALIKLWNRKKAEETRPLGLVEINIGRDSSYDSWYPNPEGKTMKWSDKATFKVVEITRYDNNKSEVKLLECKNTTRQIHSEATARTYIVKTNEISWSLYDPAEIYKEYVALKKACGDYEFKPYDFAKNLEEFKTNMK